MSKCDSGCKLCGRYKHSRKRVFQSLLAATWTMAFTLLFLDVNPLAVKVVVGTMLVSHALLYAFVLAHMSVAPPDKP